METVAGASQLFVFGVQRESQPNVLPVCTCGHYSFCARIYVLSRWSEGYFDICVERY
jgi:hypothetical protein